MFRSPATRATAPVILIIIALILVLRLAFNFSSLGPLS